MKEPGAWLFEPEAPRQRKLRAEAVKRELAWCVRGPPRGPVTTA